MRGSADSASSGETLAVRRFIPVKRERVFAAWLDPVSLALWMRPGGATGATAEVTVEFLERSGGTEVVLTHRRLPSAQLEAHRRGWTDILRDLEIQFP